MPVEWLGATSVGQREGGKGHIVRKSYPGGCRQRRRSDPVGVVQQFLIRRYCGLGLLIPKDPHPVREVQELKAETLGPGGCGVQVALLTTIECLEFFPFWCNAAKKEAEETNLILCCSCCLAGLPCIRGEGE